MNRRTMNCPAGLPRFFQSTFILILFSFLSVGNLSAQNNALAFDGTDDAGGADGHADQVLIPYTAAFDFSTGTLEMWVRPKASTANRVVAAMRTAVSTTRWSIHLNENSNQVGIWDGSGYVSMTYAGGFNPGQWYHLAFIIADDNTTEVYVNGAHEGQLGGGLNTAHTGLPFSIGGANDTGYTGEYFDGAIDEVMLWDNDQSANIFDHAENGVSDPGSAGDLIAYYKFDQGIAEGNNSAITQVTDEKGSNHGSFTEMALSGSNSNFVYSVVPGQTLADPVLSVTNIGTPNDNMFNFEIDVDKEGTLYIVALTADDTPTSTQIKAGTDGSGVAAIQAAYGVNGNNGVSVFGLLPSTDSTSSLSK